MRNISTSAVTFTVLLLVTITIALLVITAPPKAEMDNFIAYATIIPESATLAPNTFVGDVDPYQPTPSPTPKPGEIAVNAVVQVHGTEGTGLRFRQSPSLNGQELFMGFDTEVFNVIDGPRQADGYTWYYLAAVNDVNRKGWAVSQFLSNIEQ